jgi:hypothetical protein
MIDASGCSSVVESELWGFSVAGSSPATPTTFFLAALGFNDPREPHCFMAVS